MTDQPHAPSTSPLEEVLAEQAEPGVRPAGRIEYAHTIRAEVRVDLEPEQP
ncbi:MAG: hypothetical protein ACTHXC_10990 [Brachybacterium sp.]